MPIEFYCTECHALLRTGDETAGGQARCPQCGAVVPIPPAPAIAELAGPPFPPPAELRSYALGRLFGPAVGVMILNALGIGYELFLAGWNLIGLGVAGVAGVAGGQQAVLRLVSGGLALGALLAMIVANGVAIAGAIQTVRLRSYTLGWVSAVLTMLPFSCVTFPPAAVCCLPVWPVDLAVGLWFLAVLNDPMVRAAFRR